jgi:hypothetical protein
MGAVSSHINRAEIWTYSVTNRNHEKQVLPGADIYVNVNIKVNASC